MASFSTASQKRQSGGPLLFSASEPMPAVTVSFILCGGARGPWRRKVIGASSATALAGLPSDRRTCPERLEEEELGDDAGIADVELISLVRATCKRAAQTGGQWGWGWGGGGGAPLAPAVCLIGVMKLLSSGGQRCGASPPYTLRPAAVVVH